MNWFSIQIQRKILGAFQLALILTRFLRSVNTELCYVKVPEPWPNFKIKGKVFQTFSWVGNSAVCVEACDAFKECHSVNFYKSGKTCELNTATHVSHPSRFIAASGSTYIMHLPAPLCSKALGMESGEIADSKLTANGWKSPLPNSPPKLARLNKNTHGWCPATNQLGNHWIQVDLSKTTYVVAVATQGQGTHSGNWVTSYSLKYSSDGVTFTDYENGKRFAGNRDGMKNAIQPAIVARYIRVYPQTFRGAPAMRLELYGGC